MTDDVRISPAELVFENRRVFLRLRGRYVCDLDFDQCVKARLAYMGTSAADYRSDGAGCVEPLHPHETHEAMEDLLQ